MITTSNAQRYFGQSAISAHTGYGSDGYNIGISGEKYLGRTFSIIKANFNFASQKKEILEWEVPTNRYTLNISYNYSLEKQMSTLVFINIGGGALIGAEQIKKINLPDGVTQYHNNDFIMGAFIAPQIEFVFKKGSNISSFIEPQIAFDFIRKFDPFIYNIKMGLKFYL